MPWVIWIKWRCVTFKQTLPNRPAGAAHCSPDQMFVAFSFFFFFLRFFIKEEGEADSCRCKADTRASFTGLHKGAYPLPVFNQSQWDGMGFIALWWRALLWRWTVTLLSKWNHRLASIPREKGHLLSTGECSRGGYARWRLHAFSTRLPCIGTHLCSEQSGYAKAEAAHNIDFEHSLALIRTE